MVRYLSFIEKRRANHACSKHGRKKEFPKEKRKKGLSLEEKEKTDSCTKPFKTEEAPLDAGAREEV